MVKVTNRKKKNYVPQPQQRMPLAALSMKQVLIGPADTLLPSAQEAAPVSTTRTVAKKRMVCGRGRGGRDRHGVSLRRTTTSWQGPAHTEGRASQAVACSPLPSPLPIPTVLSLPFAPLPPPAVLVSFSESSKKVVLETKTGARAAIDHNESASLSEVCRRRHGSRRGRAGRRRRVVARRRRRRAAR